MDYKVCGIDDPYNRDVKFEKEYEDWTSAQDKAVQLLEDDVEWVQILINKEGSWGLLQELNLERGIMPPTSGWNTHCLAPYYIKLRGL